MSEINHINPDSYFSRAFHNNNNRLLHQILLGISQINSHPRNSPLRDRNQQQNHSTPLSQIHSALALLPKLPSRVGLLFRNATKGNKQRRRNYQPGEHAGKDDVQLNSPHGVLLGFCGPTLSEATSDPFSDLGAFCPSNTLVNAEIRCDIWSVTFVWYILCSTATELGF